MTVALFASRADSASVNLRDRFLETGTWTDTGTTAADLPILACAERDLVLFESDDLHLWCDGLDAAAAAALGQPLDAVLVLSKHKAESGSPSLTVHPIGNWQEAQFGGRDHAFTPAAPALATRVLREMGVRAKAARLKHAVTFEATHHGPHFETPTAFVEIGTDEAAWRDPKLGALVRDAVLAALPGPVTAPASGPVLIGVGGSHYVPRATDLARKRDVAFGHLMPGYQVDAGVTREVVERAVAATPGVTGFLVDPRGIKSDALAVVALLEACGLSRVRPDDLAPRAAP